MSRVGIPRALLYYQYYPMWRTFFEELGAEVVVSPITNRNTLLSGTSRVVADTCLPVKIFIGHAISLSGKCDFLLVPSIRSIRKKVYNCSKFLGLPDMTRAAVPEAPPILDMEIDVNRGRAYLYQSIYSAGKLFSGNPLKIRRAALAAWEANLKYAELMSEHGLTPPEAIELMFPSGSQAEAPQTQPSKKPLTSIAVVGHPYVTYDDLVNHRLLYRLRQAHVRILTPEMATPSQLEAATNKVVGRAHWTYEDEVLGAGSHYLESGVDGVIGLLAFGCGPDSLMMDMARRHIARSETTPFMSLTFDEHTADAGVITRLEAFLDLIVRKKRRAANA
ncbi:MAG: hypothetical protein HY667_04055 [Chloroflexi bacterium]|nr:hypothetical protein [Chloroflexota bacterium]